jgi:hypothetical protein
MAGQAQAPAHGRQPHRSGPSSHAGAARDLSHDDIVKMLGHWRGGDRRGVTRDLTNKLRSALRRRRIPAGTRLPAARVLAIALDCNHKSVTRAIETLANEGVLTTHPRSRARIA